MTELELRLEDEQRRGQQQRSTIDEQRAKILEGRNDEGAAAALLRNQLSEVRDSLQREEVHRRLAEEKAQQLQQRARGSQQQLGRVEQQLEGAQREATQERERAESEAVRHDAELLALQRQVGACLAWGCESCPTLAQTRRGCTYVRRPVCLC